jgi:DNA-binding winged helix-turn-helix (wHTH) protein/TolB-like protein
MVYRFESYELDTSTFELMENSVSIPVEPQVFDLIVFLIKNRERLISRQELFNSLWHGRDVCDTSLSNHIKSARKALGDNGHSQQIIKTVHGRGYQFIAKIDEPKKTTKTIPQLKFYKIIIIIVLFAGMTLLFLSNSRSLVSKSDAIKSNYLIAVLPFANTKPDTDTDYLGFSMADRIIGDLNYLKGITVRPSSSVRKYSNTNSYSPRNAGADLNVDYVLTGNYLSVANKIRLNAELIDVHSGELIWRTDQIEVDYKNTFELQDIVAQQIMEGLEIELSQTDIDRIRRDIPVNALAYENYLRSISQPLTTEGHQLAITLLKKSMALDNQYAPAYVQLGNRIRRLEQYGLINSGESQDTHKYYQKALSLNNELMSALSHLAFFYTETNRINDAMEITQRMLKINPDNAATHFTLGYIYRYAGINEESIKEMEIAISADPNNIRFRSIVATYSGMHKWDKGLEFIKRYDKSSFTIGWNGLLNLNLGRPKIAQKYFEELITEDLSGLWGQVARVHLAFIKGDMNEGLYATHKLEQTNISDAETVYHSAAYYGLLNDKTRCIQTLKKAVESGYFNYQFIKSSSYFNSVKSDPSFLKILSKAKQKSTSFRKRYLSN